MNTILTFVSSLSAKAIKATMTAFLLLGLIAAPFTAAYADTINRYLSTGMSGTDVSLVQTFLARDTSLYPQGLVTGYFGGLTKTAVINFQNRNGIDPVGRIGPATLPVLNAQMNGAVMSNGTAPAIYNVSVGMNQNTATVAWNTGENASALIYYSTSPLMLTEASASSDVTVSGTSMVVHTDQRTAHSANITGLQSNTTYYYLIYSRDASGNASVTWPATFHTTN